MSQYMIKEKHLRPEIFHCVKFGDETQIFCPTFTLVIFEIPESPSAGRQIRTVSTRVSLCHSYNIHVEALKELLQPRDDSYCPVNQWKTTATRQKCVKLKLK